MELDKNKTKIIDQLLENKFTIDNFKEFCSKILNVSVKNYNICNKVFEEYIENYQEISEYTDNEKSKICILIVKIKEKKDPIKARVKQREFIANILRRKNVRGALVAFYNENHDNWRISLIKLDYQFTSKGIKENLTPAKRLSYVVGKGEACKTAKDQFYTLSSSEDSVTLNQLENIFALEKVTNNFFKEYKDKYLDIKKLLIEDNVFMEEAKKHDTEKPENFAEGFTKKLMGQIIFLYFLQKKGWLGVKIVPETLNQQQFNRFYGRALSSEKLILEKAYAKVDFDSYILRKNELNTILNKEEIDLLASPFRNTEYFNEWGTGDKKFIRNLFELHKKNDVNNKKTFFDDYLEVLFYNNLSKDRGEIQYSLDFNCRIPFLNGGLFDPYGDYDWENTSFNLSDDIFSNKNKTGILDIFDIYNFTINENDSYEAEVAVDPEMLGKVFENLLEISDKKSKGAFYTPREIVRYMTNESIINYLLTNLEGKNITKDDLEYLFFLGEFSKEYDQQKFEKDFLVEEKSLTDESGNSKLDMPKNIIIHCEEIDQLLEKIKIADPACGSGAFPLGILNEIVRTRNVLTFYIDMFEFIKEKETDKKKYWGNKFKNEERRTLYNLKIDTIQNCLYGVDIEPSAIDITKLRLWLSILVDSDNNNIKPLPNLDFNFMIGNSLIDEFKGYKLFDEKLLKKPEKKYTKKTAAMKIGFSFEDMLNNYFNMQHEFFNPYVKNKKIIKEQLLDLELSLIEKSLKENDNDDDIFKELNRMKIKRVKPYFIWKLFYGKVFIENGGFDIIIGNPPYIGEDGHKDDFRAVSQTTFGKRTYMGKMDYFYFFFHLGLDLLKEKGILTFITTNYFLTADGAKKLREDLKKRSIILNLLNFNEYKIFDTAKGQHNIITLLQKRSGKMVKEKESKNFICNRKENRENKILENILWGIDEKTDYYSIEQNNLYEEENNFIRITGVNLKTGTALDNIITKLMSIKNKLKDICIINQGLISGCDTLQRSVFNKFKNLVNVEVGDGVYVLDLKNNRDFNIYKRIKEENKDILKPFFKNSDISKYIVNENPKKYVIYITHIEKEKNPILYNHLLKFKEILEERLKTYNEKYPWYSLHRAREEKIFTESKIIVPYRGKNVSFAYTEVPWYFRTDVYSIVLKEPKESFYKYLLSILNSKLCYLWLYHKGKKKGETLEFFPTSLYEIPIKTASKDEQDKYIQIVDKIIELKKLDKNTQELENQIDEMVYDLYELTEEEKKLVREF